MKLTQWQRTLVPKLLQLVYDTFEARGEKPPSDADAYALIAIALKESGGVGLLSCAGCAGGDAAAKRTADMLHCTKQDVYNAAFIVHGPYRGRYSRWYTDQQNIAWAEEHAHKEWGKEANGRVALASSWGIWQQTMRWYLPKYPRGTWYEVFNRFIASEQEQCITAFHYWIHLMRVSKYHPALAFSRYNAGEGCPRVTSYGAYVNSLYAALLSEYTTL